MAKIIFDKSNHVDMPTLLLQNRDSSTNGIINASNFVYKDSFYSTKEISFTVHKNSDESQNSVWEQIKDFKIIHIPEYGESYEIYVTLDEENGIRKEVQGIDLAVSELSQTNLCRVEINTDSDIKRNDYDADYPTIFYRSLEDHSPSPDKKGLYEKLKSSSLLHRILEKVPHYSIRHVDASLAKSKNWYTFSFDGTSIYDALTGEVAKQYQCLFQFDSVNRTLSAYDLCNTCNDCGYRGDFHDTCPECESLDFSGAYGNNTTILISKENLVTKITTESNEDSLKNCFRISGGDDLMTATVSSCNPNGSSYIYYFSDETKKDMPQELVEKIEAYNSVYNHYLKDEIYHIPIETQQSYNEVINEISKVYPDKNFHTLPSSLTGYEKIIESKYNLIDLSLFVYSGMMPTPETRNETLEETMDMLLRELSASNIAVHNPSNAVLSSVNNAISGFCKVIMNTALYKLEILLSEYKKDDPGEWTGTFKLISIEDETKTLISNKFTIAIESNEELYIKQKIEKAMAKSDSKDLLSITDISIDEAQFIKNLELYGISRLSNFHDSFYDCLSIILDSKSNNFLTDTVYTKYYNLYYHRAELISKEFEKRNEQYEDLEALGTWLKEKMTEVNTILNFQKFLSKNNIGTVDDRLWKLFCSYRREDEYTNSNYISDNLTNPEIIVNARDLLAVAKKELYRAGNLQYTISTTMNNLLALPEFQPIVDDFKCGNWINLEVDGHIYKLRLLSYQIPFDGEGIQTITVEFSTLEKVWSGISDIKSVLDSVTSMASSFDSVARQADHNKDTSSYVKGWVENGLDTTTTRIVNDADNQDIVYDKSGILCRRYDDIEDRYSDYQLKIINNGLYVTKNNWKTSEAGIGRIIYTDPEKNVEVDTYGVIAKTVIGKLFLGTNLKIYNENGSLKFTEDGLSVSNGTNTVSINPNDNKIFKISNKNGNCLFITPEGNLYVTGVIDAKKGGQIGGFDIGDTYLSNGVDKFAGADNSVYLGVDGISCGKKFTVKSNGEMSCSRATVVDKLFGCYLSNNEEKGKVEIISAGTSTIPEHHSMGTDYKIFSYGAQLGNEESSLYIGKGVFQTLFQSFNNFSGFCYFGNNVQFKRPVLFESVIRVEGARITSLEAPKIESINISTNNLSFPSGNYLTSSEFLLPGGNINGSVNIKGGISARFLESSLLTLSESDNQAQLSLFGDELTITSGRTPQFTINLANGHTSIKGTLNSAVMYDNNLVSNNPNLYITSYGNIRRTTAASSSKRYKENIKYLTNIEYSTVDDSQIGKSDTMSVSKMKDILNIPIVFFNYKQGHISGQDFDYNKDIPGFIVEDIERVFPYAVEYQIIEEEAENGDIIAKQNLDRPESWDYRKLIPAMLYIEQEQEQKINEMASEIAELKKQIEDIKLMVSNIK